jgi:hypothetical protein
MTRRPALATVASRAGKAPRQVPLRGLAASPVKSEDYARAVAVIVEGPVGRDQASKRAEF